MIYELGIFATIRSGSTYILHVLRHCNVAVGHGRLECEGAVLVDFTRRANPTRFVHAWHQTRDPLATIGSIAASADLWWREKTGSKTPGVQPDDSPILKAMRYWAWWSGECETRTDWRYKIEDVCDGSPLWLEICERLSLGQMIFPELARTLNGKPHPEVAWDELHELDDPLATEIAARAEMYGYNSC